MDYLVHHWPKESESKFKENVGLLDFCKNDGYRYLSIRSRMYSQCMSLQEAILIPARISNTIQYEGKECDLKELCGYLHKNYDQVYEALMYNRTIEWALEHAKEV